MHGRQHAHAAVPCGSAWNTWIICLKRASVDAWEADQDAQDHRRRARGLLTVMKGRLRAAAPRVAPTAWSSLGERSGHFNDEYRRLTYSKPTLRERWRSSRQDNPLYCKLVCSLGEMPDSIYGER